MSGRVEYVNPSQVGRPKGEYSHVAILPVAGARLCFLTGQVGYDEDGQAAPDLESQMDLTFGNLRAVLESVGASLHSLLQLTTYLTSESLLTRYAAKRRELFPRLFGTRYPPNALVVVRALARPQLLVEVQAIAAAPGS